MTKTGNNNPNLFGAFFVCFAPFIFVLLRFPTEFIENAKKARGFISLTGEYTTNSDVFLSLVSVASWSSVIAILLLCTMRKNLRSSDWGFVTGVQVGTWVVLFWMAEQGMLEQVKRIFMIFVPLSVVLWGNREMITAFLARVRLRFPITLSPD